MRAIWSGAISFGLVNIPVKLYSAVTTQSLDLDMLSKKDMSPIKYKRVSAASGEEVDYKDIVKGYEYSKGEYVIINEKDFEKASPEKYRTIDIVDFTSEKEIDAVYFDKPYYLEPDKGAGKAYTLLLKALQKSGKVGIARFMIRNRERIGVVKPLKDVVLLEQIRFASEIRSYEDLNLPKAQKLSPKEIEMAVKLIDQLTTKFDPETYKDTYIEELKKIIEAKAKGKEIKMPKMEKPSARVTDLMEVLKESLKATKNKAA